MTASPERAGAEKARTLAARRQPRLDMEGLVGTVLLVGVLSSVSLIVVGLAWHFAKTGEFGIEYSLTGMSFYGFLLDDSQRLLAHQLRPRLLVSLGIALLMLTPFVRVLASMVYFAVAARNWKYTAFTAVVLSILTYSLFLR